jgi:hypothetical protein
MSTSVVAIPIETKTGKALSILISPTGEEFFNCYGPMSKNRALATEFVSFNVASGAGDERFGRNRSGFWNCEIEAEARAREKYRGWTSRVVLVVDEPFVLAGGSRLAAN